MAIMSVSSIIPALPLMTERLHISQAAVGWIISAFTLPGVITAPIAGILADRYSRKTVLVPALFLFALAGSACFFAKDITTLLILRFVQGLAAGPIGILNLTLIGDFFEGRERATAMGYNGSVLSIGTAAFPAVGGMLALLGWNWPFLLPLLAIPLALVVIFRLHPPTVAEKPDMGRYMRESWKNITSPRALGLFSMSLLTFIILYGVLVTYLPLLLADSFSAGPATIGWVIAVSSFMTALASSQLGRLSGRFRARSLLLAACGFYATAMVLIPLASNIWLCGASILFFGVAQGLNIPTIMTMLSSLTGPEHRAAVMATNGMVLRLGQTLGPMIMGLAFAGFGMTGVFATAFAVAACMALLVPLTQKGNGDDTRDG